MKKILKKLLPSYFYIKVRGLFRYIRTLRCFIYDMNKYYKYSVDIDDSDESKALSHIMMKTHVVEKGLTMPNMKFGFGQQRILDLLKMLEQYMINYGTSNPRIYYSIGVLKDYSNIHYKRKETLSEDFISKLEIFLNQVKDVEVVKQSTILKDNYFRDYSNFIEFSNSRHSVRNFTKEKVDLESLLDAVEMCKNSPSACNRQSVRVHIYQDYDTVQKILKIQGGNRGFGNLVSNLAIITYDMSSYFEGIERNAGFVDGGIYSMNLLYFLHELKLGACILNTSTNINKDKNLRKVTEIPNNEEFVSMIAIGIIPDKFKIALSRRDSINFIVKVHKV